MSSPKSTLQARFLGLLDYLSLTNQGTLPDQIGSVVSPTFDVFEFIAAGRRERLNSQITAVNARGGHIMPGTTVQPREAWLIYSYAVESSSVTGALGFSPTYYRPASFGAGIQHETCGRPYLYTGAAANVGSVYSDRVPYLAVPGTQLGVIVHLIPGAAFDLYATCDFIRIRL